MKAKRIVALLMATTMVASLTACGGSSNTAATTDTAAEDTAEDDTEDADAEDTADADTEDSTEAVDLSDVIPEETDMLFDIRAIIC